MTDLEFYLSECRDSGKGHTIGQFTDAVGRVQTVEDAARFFRGEVEWLKGRDDMTGDAEDIARQNIGYVIGYLGDSERKRVGTLFAEACGAYHPAFGSLTRDISPEEAFTAGAQMATATEKARTR